MTDLVVGGASLAVVLVVLVGLSQLAARARRRGVDSASVMGPFEEMWHPAASRARLDVEVQQEVREPAPTPGTRLRRRWSLRHTTPPG